MNKYRKGKYIQSVGFQIDMLAIKYGNDLRALSTIII